jgi:hypothetical protein
MEYNGMGQKKQFVTRHPRLRHDQDAAIKRIAEREDRPEAWVFRRLIDIGIEQFSMPSCPTDGAIGVPVDKDSPSE